MFVVEVFYFDHDFRNTDCAHHVLSTTTNTPPHAVPTHCQPARGHRNPTLVKPLTNPKLIKVDRSSLCATPPELRMTQMDCPDALRLDLRQFASLALRKHFVAAVETVATRVVRLCVMCTKVDLHAK